MPICTRPGLDKKAEPVDNFRETDKVFFCELTKEIFRGYEGYFQRVMLLNSTIWSCSETGKQNLTYAEALKSEKRARKIGEKLSDWVKGPALLLIQTQEQTSFRVLLSKTFVFVKDRFFKGEVVASSKSKHNYVPCKIVDIIPPKETPADGVYDAKTLKYKVQKLSGTETWIGTTANIRRRRTVMSLEMLKVFLKDNTFTDANGIRAKPESYEKYVTSKKLTFSSFFVGKMPKWEPGKRSKGLVQASMGNYVTNDPANSHKELESLKETMERLRREKEEKQAQQERKRQEIAAKVEEEYFLIMRKCEDQERTDQKVMPLYKPVKTLVASKYFSEFLMIQEFLHAFAPMLAASDVFRTNITFQQMCRSFLVREVAGPLSDILQVLLSTIFTLQIEENNDCPVWYTKNDRGGLLWNTANSAVEAQLHVNKYYSAELFELPIDAQTLSEVLRLHLLSSGATTDEKSQSWRYQYRNGYSVTEDPGLLLRIQYPHILRSLKMYTIYQLPFKDILKVVNCLVEQILTYNATIALLEERQENQVKIRNNLRLLITNENKRIQTLQNTKKVMSIELQTEIAECQGDAEKVAELQRVFNKKIKDMDDQDLRLKGNFQYSLDKMNVELFDYLTLLGSDRAYRNYYVFESLPGLFIEHPILEEAVPCLDNPPKNDEVLAAFPKERHRLRTFLFQRHRQGDKENMSKPAEPSEAANVAPVNGEVVKVNGTSNGVSNAEKVEKTPPTATDLYMCSGDPKTCIVHNSRHPSRTHWSFINTVEEFDALMESLNSYGSRENALKEILGKARKQIVLHILKCSATMLTVDIEDRANAKEQMLIETQKKYANSNFGFPENANINEVMHATLTNQILEFEQDITVGNLGKMKIPDIVKWRQNIADSVYSSQCKNLKYGPEPTTDGEKDTLWVELGRDLGDTLDIESEDSADDEVCVLDSPTMQQSVIDLASALLQIEQSIEQKFLKEPFGLKNQVKNREEEAAKLAAGKAKLQQWEVSLMNSTNYSQIFLHLNILSDAVKWNKSSMKSSCLVCKRRGDAEKLLLCDECNAGTHMFCMKPPMKKIPEGNWYCYRCELKLGLNKASKPKKKTKKIFSMEEEEKEDDDFSETKNSGRNKKSKKGKKNAKFLSMYEDSDGPNAGSTSNESDEDNSDDWVKYPKKRPKKNGRVAEEYDTEDDKPLKTNGWTKKNGKQSTSKAPTPVESDAEEVDADETLDDEDSDDDRCKTCNTDGTDLSCNTCKDCYHLECTGLRRMPRGNWVCVECKAQEIEKKRKAADIGSESEDEAYEEDESFQNRAAKRQRRSHTKDISLSNDDVSKNNNNSRRSRRTEEFLKLDTIILYDLLEQIMKHKSAWPFLRPVSANEVPDYHTIIKNPMDFARIKSNLNMCRYSTNEDVIKDIELVFRNCDMYNTEGNEIYTAGASLERFVLEKCKELNLKFTPSDMIADQA